GSRCGSHDSVKRATGLAAALTRGRRVSILARGSRGMRNARFSLQGGLPMPYRPSRTSACWTVFVSLLVVVLAGCATAPEPAPVTATSTPGAVAYSNGQYKLYGSGTTASPYYWVWIPAGVTAPTPPPITTNPTVNYPTGQYQLRGDGT